MMNQRLDDNNRKSMGIGNGQYRKYSRFSSNGFWKNIGFIVSVPTFGNGGLRLWEREEKIKIGVNSRNSHSIRIKVDLYEFCLL